MAEILTAEFSTGKRCHETVVSHPGHHGDAACMV
jgi:hypothetical protein